MKRITICTYDNPATMTREAWQDGKILCSITARLLSDRDFKGGPHFPFMLNSGIFASGKIIGNPKALDALNYNRLTP